MPILSYFPSGGSGEITVSVATPTQQGTLTYTGESLTPEWSGYDPEKLTLSGTLSATDAGSYIAVFTPKVGYCWEDLTVDPREVTWTVSKAAGSVTASVSSISLNTSSTKTATFTLTKVGDGTLKVVSSNTAVAKVSLSGTKVTVTSVGAGTAKITVSVAESTNYTAATDVTLSVSVVCVWKKYSVVESTVYDLYVASRDEDLDEVIEYCVDGDDEYDGDEWAQEYCDDTLTYGTSFFSYYSDISIDDSGEITPGTSCSYTSASYVKYENGSNDIYYYIGYREGTAMYLFELSVTSYETSTMGDYISDVTSTNAGAYPDDGVKNGYWYVKQ